MTINRFIEKAIEGGWDFTDNVNFSEEDRARFKRTEHLKDPKNIAGFWGAVFLDPEAWKAVGKVEGWEEACEMSPRTGRHCYLYTNATRHTHDECCYCGRKSNGTKHTWQDHMHRMIDALAEGKSVEEFIATL